MTTQTTTTFVGIVGRNENLFRETKSGGSAGGNQTNNQLVQIKAGSFVTKWLEWRPKLLTSAYWQSVAVIVFLPVLYQ